MERSEFLLESELNDIKAKFVKGGWVDIFRNGNTYSGGVFCYLIKSDHLSKHLETNEKAIWKGSEGRPSVSTYTLPNGEITRYSAFNDEHIEPFLYCKHFPEERYIDVSEEFVNYFKLYENGTSKQERKYYFLDDSYDKEEVIVITPEVVRVKLKFLKEYIAVRRMDFIVCFDFMAIGDVPLKDWDIKLKEEDYSNDWHNYKHCINVSFGSTEIQSWITGKLTIKHDPRMSLKTWYDSDYQYEEFIIGHDDESGEEILVACNSEDHKFFVPVFFKKGVLNKYYNDPDKYKVSGFGLSCNAFSVKIDNNNDEYVVVFLNDLQSLPYKEQLYWKHYNIAREPGMGISSSYYNTMIQGNWADKSGSIDIRFKQEYERFNKRWFQKFGWYFYKPASGSDISIFKALHLPTDNSIISFCNQMLAIVKFTIDSLNEEVLVKDLPKVDNEKGIAKFERFIKEKGLEIPDMISFLRHLQDLRSGFIAHKFSESSRSVKRAKKFFGMDTSSYREVASDIFIKSLWTINALTKYFLETPEEEF
ncbi:hypothetical protein [Sphingobacterium tabacisoli]|uniref:ApeA N-terminal domain-containing protein n=1 Tax=Sphingobacterium tabacisoli TaxID=2044855 RepID=A0ABW5L566_9SPHI|nr:hypothetical protein [Sphingobacterium tabacisoli]